jgi:hypothetical protein
LVLSRESDLLQRLQDAHDEARGRVATLKEQLRAAEHEADSLSRALSALGVQAEAPDARALTGDRLRVEARRLLQELDPERHGIHATALVARLHQEDLAVKGTNEVSNLISHLNRSSDFRRVGRGVYCLNDRES